MKPLSLMCPAYRRRACIDSFGGFSIELLSFDPMEPKRAGDANNPSGGNDAGTTLLCLQGARDKELYFQSNYAAIIVNWGTVVSRSIQALNTVLPGCTDTHTHTTTGDSLLQRCLLL